MSDQPSLPSAVLDPDFRLSEAVRPLRYEPQVTLDPAAKRFTGHETIELQLDAPQRHLILHANGLDVVRAAVRTGTRRLEPSSIRTSPVSETLVLEFPEAVPAGRATLELEWSGRFTEGLNGLYDAKGIAVTQFESADARRMFPCFDEPGFKARWQLTLRVPASVPAVLSNTAPEKEERADGLRTLRYRETPPLPTYLVALVAGDLVASPRVTTRTGVPVQAWATADKLHLTEFALEAARVGLEQLEDYFGLPYAFGKVDLAGVPDFAAGAMENAGLVTFREIALLADAKTASLAQKRRIAEVVIHEVAHQWFGNLVTMKWWNDLWLNEAFATWIAAKVCAAWQPDWRVWSEFDKGKAAGLGLDALRSTHPVGGEVRNAAHAEESFDKITYQKGGAVLRMIEAYLGEDAFREGLRAYMRTHREGNAEAADLWRALQEASAVPVGELARAWIGQAGFPLLTVTREGARVHFRQERYYSEPGAASDETWPIPVILRFEDDAGTHEQRAFLEGREGDVELKARGTVRWLFANGAGTGFYRTAYGPDESAALAQNLGKLASSERVALLSDTWSLVRSERRSVADFLELSDAFTAEQDPSVLEELVGGLGVVDRDLLEGDSQETFRAHVAENFRDAFARLGWDERPGEHLDTRQLRAALLQLAGGVGRDRDLVAEARRRVERLLAGDATSLAPDVRSIAIGLAAREGNAALFDGLLARYRAEADPTLARSCLMALATFEPFAQARRARELALSETVKAQDFAFYLMTLLDNPTAVEETWAMVQDRWADCLARSTGMLTQRLVEAIGRLKERRHLEEAEALFRAHPETGAQNTVSQTLEAMRLGVRFREQARPVARGWVGMRFG